MTNLKVKIIHFDPNRSVDSFETDINKFIKSKDVVDIKYQESISSMANDYAHDTDYQCSAMVIYHDKEVNDDD